LKFGGMIVARPRLLGARRAALRRRSIVVLTGPRQCGKTTLARQILDPSESTYVDLEALEPEHCSTSR